MGKTICLFAFIALVTIVSSVNATTITMEPGDRYVDHGFSYHVGMYDNLFANPYENDASAGYTTVLTSGDYVAFQYMDDAYIELANGSTWDFTGAYWASVWDESNILTLKGYAGATLLYSTTTALSRSSKLWIQSNFSDITRLAIISSGTQVAWDNFEYNKSTPPPTIPEPATLLLLGSGLAGLAFYRRKKK